MSMAQDAMRKNRPKPPTRRYPKIEDSVVVAGITPHVRRFSSPHRLPTHRGAWARFWKGENPGLERRLWLTFANLAGLVLTVLAILGCISPGFQWRLTHVNRSELAYAANASTNEPLEYLNSPKLPTSWNWGFSGVCANYENYKANCIRYFPPTLKQSDIIREFLIDPNEMEIKNITAAWDNAIAALGADGQATGPLRKTRTTFVSYMMASIVLTVSSIVLACTIIVLNFWVPWTRMDRRVSGLYGLTIIDAAVTFAACCTACISIRYGPQGIAYYATKSDGFRQDWSAGIVSLILATLFKLSAAFTPFVAVLWFAVFLTCTILTWPNL